MNNRRNKGGKPFKKEKPFKKNTSWDKQAKWYDERQKDTGDYNHQNIIIPEVIRNLKVKPNELVFDCCCGQGVVANAIVDQGAKVLGLDGSSKLIEMAKKRFSEAGDNAKFIQSDAHEMEKALSKEVVFNHAIIIMALQDLDPIDKILKNISNRMKKGGKFVVVVTHPCFRIPKHCDWHKDKGNFGRIITSYLASKKIKILTNPSRRESVNSNHFHRPISEYINAIASAGLMIDNMKEISVPWRGEKQNAKLAEDIPTFMLIKAVKI